MLRIGTTVMGVQDMSRAVRFWCEALDYLPRDDEQDDDWTTLVPRDGDAGSGLSLERSESPVQSHPRVHLDLYAGDDQDQQREVDRLIGLGATRVDWDSYPEDPDFVVLADPEGNLFCVIDTVHGGEGG